MSAPLPTRPLVASPERGQLLRALDLGFLLIGLVSVVLLVIEIGWRLGPTVLLWQHGAAFVVSLAAIAAETIHFRKIGWRGSSGKLRMGLILAGLQLLALLGLMVSLRSSLIPDAGDGDVTRKGSVLVLALSQVMIALAALLRVTRSERMGWLHSVPPLTLAALSFIVAILAGTGMLMTPAATVNGIGFLDALFTATSAVCVTGLIVVDTAVDLTITGQVLVLVMIQVGGLGIMTLTYFLAMMLGQGIGLRDQVLLSQLFSDSNLGLIGHFVRRVVLLTLGFELLGFLGLWWSWQASGNVPDQLLWHCAFHSISAFCNAGFSTFSDGLMDSTTIGNRPFQAVIMGLIILGGLGFFVVGQTPRLLHGHLHKVLRSRRKRARMPVHIRLVLVSSGLLLVGGWIGFWGIDLAHHGGEAFNGGHAWTALFNAVTARTAGFNTMNMANLSAGAMVLMIVLMFIGGSPGGTAGGVKTTTVALGLLELWRILRGQRDLQIGDRRIAGETLERAHATMVIAMLWIVVTVIALSLADRSHRFDDLLFEVVSAFGTVGLSRGITSDLSSAAKLVLILTMYVGRIGILTLGFTLVGPPRPQHYRLPTANLPL